MPFGFPSVLQPKAIAYDTTRTFTRAKIVVNSDMLSNPADFSWYVSADGGTTWDQLSTNVWTTLSTPGNHLLLQVLGNPGAVLYLHNNKLEVLYQ